ncbi:MAG: C40 family peptidase [Eubacteriales bacterium]|nr:C40 family peptidase [Eubacteriales bacterium]
MKCRVKLLVTFLLMICMTVGVSIQSKASDAVKLNKSRVVVDLSGDTVQLKVKNTTSKVKWSSADENLVKVNKKGELAPNEVGVTTVTATVDGKKYNCKVIVVDYAGMSDEQKEVVAFAVKHVGNRYVYGGSSLTKGTDCSGFTMSVYGNFGYDLVHNAKGQMDTVKKVSMKKIKPGDLIFYGSSKASCSHVAMYIGHDKVVHASNEQTGITISDFNYRNYVGVGRVLETETYTPDGKEFIENTNSLDEMARYAKSR